MVRAKIGPMSYLRGVSILAAALAAWGCSEEVDTTTGAGGDGGTAADGGGGSTGAAGPTGGSGGEGGTMSENGFAVVPAGTGNATAEGVVVDADDNIIVTGSFTGTLDFGGQPMSSGTAQNDAFIVKLDPDGEHVWSRQLGTSDGYNRVSLASGGGDAVVIGGHFSGTFTAGATDYVAGTGGDLYVARWSASGDLEMLTVFPCDADSFVTGASVDGAGNILVGGSFAGTCDFGGTQLIAANGDGFIVSVDPAGAVAWARQIGGAAIGDGVWGVGFDPSGNAVASGQFRGATDFGDGNPISPDGVYDLFVARYDADGNHVSHRAIVWEGTGYLDGSRMEADPSGSAILAGQFASITLESTFTGESDNNQIFVAAFDGSNDTVFALELGTLGVEDHVRGVGVGADGRIAIAGVSAGPIDFGGGALPTTNASFAAVFSATGEHVFSDRVGTGGIAAEDTTIDHMDNVIVVGGVSGPADLGYGPITASGSPFIVKRILP